MKVALVHDWFVGGGAEKVVQQLHKMYPEAPIYTSYCSLASREKLAGAHIITGYLQHWPFSKLRKFLPPLRALWFSRLDLSEFDLVISSSGAEAKAVKVKKPATHINYCHAPTHYYWSRYEEYMRHPGFGFLDPLARIGLRVLIAPMRHWDKKASARPDYLIANSSYIKQQIKKYYGRSAEVIHPPVEVEKFKPKSQQPRQGFLIAGRQTPYKRFDLAVTACSELGLPLTVVGNGPDHNKLRRSAGPTITFTGWVTEDQRVKYFQSAEAFIFPGVDDFGIVAVEALAAGTPVIACKAGGALDYVTRETGLFFDPGSLGSLMSALESFDPAAFSAAELTKSAEQFRASEFRRKMSELIMSVTGPAVDDGKEVNKEGV